jgi:hypothetical protein
VEAKENAKLDFYVHETFSFNMKFAYEISVGFWKMICGEDGEKIQGYLKA